MTAVSPPTSAPAYGTSLADVIVERCASAFQHPGGRLPTERQLAADLGVTRTMVRHALAVLEAEGSISREVGRGTFIRPRPSKTNPGGASPDVHDLGPAHVMAARRVIEPQVLPLVVAWATSRDFEEMRRCLNGGAEATSYDEFESWDYALHHAIVQASRNPLLAAMYADIERARKGALWGNLKRRGDTAERRAAYQGDHVALVEALRSRDVAGAMEVMERHLIRVQENLLGTDQSGERT